MKETILVTGGAGFIGSHLCEALLKQDNHVICLDNLSTGQRRNIIPFFHNKNFEFIEHDITKPIYFDRIDELYHLACPASPVAYTKDPLGTLKTCSEGTRNALAIEPHKFLLASTSEVYGDPMISPQPESYNGNVSLSGPRACYDEGKRYAEVLVRETHRATGLNTKIARIFNTYGPRMDSQDGRAIPTFLWQARHTNIIPVHGKGLQTRSFCYVTDLVEGLIKLMASEEQGPINLGNPEEVTILELAKRIKTLTQSKAEIVHHGRMQNDPEQRKPDITLARKALGWTPKVSLDQGLKKLIPQSQKRVLVTK